MSRRLLFKDFWFCRNKNGGMESWGHGKRLADCLTGLKLLESAGLWCPWQRAKAKSGLLESWRGGGEDMNKNNE